MNLSNLRHPKEQVYRTLCLIIGALIWIPLFIGALLFIPIVALFAWIASLFFKASLYGNAVQVSKRQFTELHEMKMELAAKMGIQRVPDFFIFNADGAMNALAIKFLNAKYILLFSGLVDLLDSDDKQELKAVLAHELAHHAAGHTNFWINIVMKPAMFVPFLGSAYSRACEYTADRIAVHYVGEKMSDALIQLACGSTALTEKLDVEEFLAQEQHVPGIAGFINEIYSSHPRMTRRVAEVSAYISSQPQVANLTQQAA